MSDLKPIEPGCLCLIIKSATGNHGRVTVIERVESPGFPCNPHRDWWRVDRDMLWTSGRWAPFCYEAMLMRIDGYDEQDAETTKELELTK